MKLILILISHYQDKGEGSMITKNREATKAVQCCFSNTLCRLEMGEIYSEGEEKTRGRKPGRRENWKRKGSPTDM